ncbi:MAG: hypothetical protein ACI9XK_003590 [Granulosicoccus sp.]|jgi:hypothetical protein
MENMNEQTNIPPSLSAQREIPRGLEQAKIYKLSAEMLTRNVQKIERRKFKNRLSDRRSQMRITASGEPQPDRRMGNRVAYAEMRSRLKRPQ